VAGKCFLRFWTSSNGAHPVAVCAIIDRKPSDVESRTGYVACND
jgi:hypothetical protein